MNHLPDNPPPPPKPPLRNVLDQPYTAGGGGGNPPPLDPPPLPMFEAGSQNFASAPSVPRGFKPQNFRPAFGRDHRGAEGEGGPSQPPSPSDPLPPSNTSLPLLLLLHRQPPDCNGLFPGPLAARPAGSGGGRAFWIGSRGCIVAVWDGAIGAGPARRCPVGRGCRIWRPREAGGAGGGGGEGGRGGGLRGGRRERVEGPLEGVGEPIRGGYRRLHVRSGGRLGEREGAAGPAERGGGGHRGIATPAPPDRAPKPWPNGSAGICCTALWPASLSSAGRAPVKYLCPCRDSNPGSCWSERSARTTRPAGVSMLPDGN